MFALIGVGEGDAEIEDSPTVFAAIRSDPGAVGLNTMLTEIAKLEAVRAIGLPDGAFADVAPKIVPRLRRPLDEPSTDTSPGL
ncbi:hypothetical protein ACLMAJ_31335 [Nocardia sp. KC 131]|uniref:hypothetical protein n=1 Tax=Nocardia arseniciresistens TaxID=3392119 RepID=UPI00398F2227